MRFRLGLLQDQAAIERQVAAEHAAEKHRKIKATALTAEEAEAEAAKEKSELDKLKREEEHKKPKKKPRVRPLSEAKAIDSGANFVSETFLLLVGVGCVLGERWYSSKKAEGRREDVKERMEALEAYERVARRGLVEMEREILRLRGLKGEGHILPKEVWELEEREEEEDGLRKPKQKGWLEWVSAGLPWGQQGEAVNKQEVEKPREGTPSPPPSPAPSNEEQGSIVERIKKTAPFTSPGRQHSQPAPTPTTSPERTPAISKPRASS